MRQIVIRRPGGYEELQVEECPTPKPKTGEVLVETKAIGVNYADCVVRWGLYESAKTYVGWPITPGFEFSGIVRERGAEVEGFDVGTEVFGVTRFGAYSTHVSVPARQVFARPSQLTHQEAAGFPAVFLTAYHGLFQHVRLRPHLKILVHSAAGGVGLALLQLARIAQCETVGVVGSTRKIETARAYGADFVIDKSREDLWKQAESYAPEGYDLVFDANGVTTLKQSYEHLRPTGKLVAYGFHSMLPRQGGRVSYIRLAWDYLRSPRFNPIEMTNKNRSLITFNVSFLFDRPDLLSEGMDDLLKWLSEGKIKPLPVQTFPLDQVASAHRAIESGQTVGKLVLVS